MSPDISGSAALASLVSVTRSSLAVLDHVATSNACSQAPNHPDE